MGEAIGDHGADIDIWYLHARGYCNCSASSNPIATLNANCKRIINLLDSQGGQSDIQAPRFGLCDRKTRVHLMSFHALLAGNTARQLLRGSCRKYATEAAQTVISTKPSIYGQPIFQSHPHLGWSSQPHHSVLRKLIYNKLAYS
jgi:hypothetical protein